MRPAMPAEGCFSLSTTTQSLPSGCSKNIAGHNFKYGFFDEGLHGHEGIEPSGRLSRHGFRLVYNPLAPGCHEHCVNEAGYLRAAVLDGKNLALLHRKAPFLRKGPFFFGLLPHRDPSRESKTRLWRHSGQQADETGRRFFLGGPDGTARAGIDDYRSHVNHPFEVSY
jgi:hypothetical protein